MKYDIINYINAPQVVKQNQSRLTEETKTHTAAYILHILYMNTLNRIKESMEMHAFVFNHSYLLD